MYLICNTKQLEPFYTWKAVIWPCKNSFVTEIATATLSALKEVCRNKQQKEMKIVDFFFGDGRSVLVTLMPCLKNNVIYRIILF